MLITAALIAILIYFLSNQWRRTTQLPPGPYPVLLIGNLPQILYYGYKYGGIVPALKYFKKKYGPVFTIWIGPMPSVISLTTSSVMRLWFTMAQIIRIDGLQL
ncbi:hypothetical protein OSTOST_16689 [Ostertagia ostertagi]